MPGFHTFRHTFASLMIAAGVNAKALSTFMGHANIGITLDRYGHLMPGSEAEAAQLLISTSQRLGSGQRRRHGRLGHRFLSLAGRLLLVRCRSVSGVADALASKRGGYLSKSGCAAPWSVGGRGFGGPGTELDSGSEQPYGSTGCGGRDKKTMRNRLYKDRKRRPRLCCTLLVALAAAVVGAPVGAQAAVLYDQTGHAAPTSFSVPSQVFTPSAGSDSEAADDFSVPSGQQWVIGQVDVIGDANASPPTSARVTLYSNGGTLPSTQVFTQTANGLIPPNYSIPISGAPTLIPGTYWVSVQAVGGTGGPNQWFWREATVGSGNAAAWRNPGNGFGTGCTNWAVRTTCLGGSDPDQVFKLSGTSAPYTPTAPSPTAPSNAFTFGKLKLNKKKGTGLLTVNAPGPGAVLLFGKGIKTQNAATSGPQSYTLPVIPTGKRKKKLKRTGKVKVSVDVTFTPTGGLPKTQSESVKLIKKRKH